ncbi:MAG: hypothetical protein KDK62_05540 [Chlamydiia bacterium]|nr:hypothetical protein [Chlamydiia bacterium]
MFGYWGVKMQIKEMFWMAVVIVLTGFAMRGWDRQWKDMEQLQKEVELLRIRLSVVEHNARIDPGYLDDDPNAVPLRYKIQRIDS